MKRWAVRAAIVLGALGGLGALVVVSGVVPVKASSGHWAITAWFLRFARERSVATHMAFSEPPGAGEPWRVVQGAGHYEDGCRPCHGSPGQPMPRIAAAMTPRPPRLGEAGRTTDPEHLFYIIKHGVKLTGMPGWPTLERDDEVASMVAFLRALPGMDEERYLELVHGAPAPDREQEIAAAPIGELPEPTSDPPEVARPCVRCHGLDGTGRGNAAFPKLAGQNEAYLFGALEAYARARRHSGIMEPIAAPLDDASWRELARHFAGLGADAQAGREPRPVGDDAGDARLRRGAAIAREGIRERGVPACSSCHGRGGGPQNEAYPRLGGQYEDYLAGQLRLFSQRKRGGSPYAHIMELVASRLTEEQIRDVAAHYAAQAPADAALR